MEVRDWPSSAGIRDVGSRQQRHNPRLMSASPKGKELFGTRSSNIEDAAGLGVEASRPVVQNGPIVQRP